MEGWLLREGVLFGGETLGEGWPARGGRGEERACSGWPDRGVGIRKGSSLRVERWPHILRVELGKGAIAKLGDTVLGGLRCLLHGGMVDHHSLVEEGLLLVLLLSPGVLLSLW